MWTRALLKINAKQTIARTAKCTFLVCLVYALISLAVATVPSLHMYWLDPYSSAAPLWNFIGSMLSIAVSIFITNPLLVGLYRYLMEARAGNPPMSTLFSTFRGDEFWRIVLTRLKTSIKIFLYTLLLVVPGIIKSYEYFMVPFLLAENPYLDSKRAQELSSKMMEGEKFKVFVLELSFIGWLLLVSICASLLSIVFIWMPPVLMLILTLICTILVSTCLSCYINATFAELYAALREKAFAANYTTPDELGGFVNY